MLIPKVSTRDLEGVGHILLPERGVHDSAQRGVIEEPDAPCVWFVDPGVGRVVATVGFFVGIEKPTKTGKHVAARCPRMLLRALLWLLAS